MNSRQRVIEAINFREPDRVPVDIGGSYVTGIHMDAYCQLSRALGLDFAPPKLIDQFMMVVQADIPILRWLGSDVFGIENLVRCWGYKNKDWHLWTTNKGNNVLIPGQMKPYRDEKGYTYLDNAAGERCAYMGPSAQYMDRTDSTALSDDFELVDVAKWKKSLPMLTDEALYLAQSRAKFFYENTDLALMGCFPERTLFSTGKMAGHTFSDWLCLMVMEPEYAKSVVMAAAEWQLENMKMYLEATGDYIETIIISTADFGSQRAELISPASFEDIYVPAYKLLSDYVHTHSRAKTFFHSCGSVRNLIPLFIKAGVDILNPVQTTATGMDPIELKKEFGGKIVFWGGGADTQNTLPFGTPEDVRSEVKERIAAFAPGGGYVFNQVHNLQSDIPFENICAMVDAVREFGSYSGPVLGKK